MNMKHFLITTAVMISVSTAAIAADKTPATTGGDVKTTPSISAPTSVPAAALSPAQLKTRRALQLKTLKAATIEKLDLSIASMQKQKACVKAASSGDDFSACFMAVKKTASLPLDKAPAAAPKSPAASKQPPATPPVGTPGTESKGPADSKTAH